jgi:hypothetical protein
MFANNGVNFLKKKKPQLARLSPSEIMAKGVKSIAVNTHEILTRRPIPSLNTKTYT